MIVRSSNMWKSLAFREVELHKENSRDRVGCCGVRWLQWLGQIKSPRPPTFRLLLKALIVMLTTPNFSLITAMLIVSVSITWIVHIMPDNAKISAMPGISY